jgi:hypothetical protein
MYVAVIFTDRCSKISLIYIYTILRGTMEMFSLNMLATNSKGSCMDLDRARGTSTQMMDCIVKNISCCTDLNIYIYKFHYNDRTTTEFKS